MTLSSSLQSRLEHQHESIEEMIQGMSLSQLKKRANPDKWSVFENIVHLVAYQPAFIERLELISQGNKPQFNRYVAEQDPRFDQYLSKSFEELSNDLHTDRLAILNRIKDMDEQAFSFVAHHIKFGWMPLTGWVEFFLLHEAHHLFTIFQLIGIFRVAQE